ncbi:hypothetical protein T265_15862, partial [Opisthorchis viverrini]
MNIRVLVETITVRHDGEFCRPTESPQLEFDVSNGASMGRNSLSGKGRSEDELWLVDVGTWLQQAALNVHLHHDILCTIRRKSRAARFDSATQIKLRERCWRFDVQNMLRLIYNGTPNYGRVIRYPRGPDLGPDVRCVQRVPPGHNDANILVLTDSL